MKLIPITIRQNLLGGGISRVLTHINPESIVFIQENVLDTLSYDILMEGGVTLTTEDNIFELLNNNSKHWFICLPHMFL